MARVIAFIALAIIALSSISYAAATNAIAHAAIRTGTVKGSIFFSQNVTDNSVSVKLTLDSGYTVGYNYSIFIHAYGDNFGAATHGGCFSTQTKPIGTVTPDVAAGYTIEGALENSNVDLVGATTSVIGRTIAVYENLGAETCSAAAAATPVGRGVIGAAWPGLGVANVNPAGAPLNAAPTSAYAELVGTTGTYGDNSGISGGVYFQQLADGTVTVLVQISGVSLAGQHALHVHEYGDLSLANATSMNGHWNPYKRNHGAPPGDRHAGDMGNVTADSTGYIFSQQTFDLLTLQSVGSIIGRGVVLHTLRDDGNPNNETASVGNAGGRIARGVIGVSNRAVPYPSSSTGVVVLSSSSSSTGINGAISTSSLSSVAIIIAAVVAFMVNKQ